MKESIMSDEANIKIRMNAAAGVIVRDNEDGVKQVLLIQRATNDHWPNHWECPRGKCDHGNEDIRVCAKREIKEETGLDVEVIGLIDKFQYLADGGTRLTTCFSFLCKIDPPNQKIKLSKEHQDYKWISEVGQAELLVLPDQKRTIAKVLNRERPIVADAYKGDKKMLENYLYQIQLEGDEKKPLNKPFRLPPGSKKKFGVYVKNDKGNIVKVQFGDPNMEIKRDDPERLKSFRARHGCNDTGPKWKAKYWSCKFWEKGISVSDLLKGKK
jgi:8-oxo-dGTP pyrophosphatase MutT (NUDIX family)